MPDDACPGEPENVIRIHVSQINDYQTCPRMYYFRYVCGLVPKIESPKLAFGRGVHQAIAAYYTTGERISAVKAYRQWLDERKQTLQEAGADLDALSNELSEAENIGEALLQAYMDYADQHDDFVPVSIEQPFSVPIWEPTEGGHVHYTHEGVPVYHEGTFDGVVRNKYGSLQLIEHKTASSFPSAQLLRVDQQVGFYLLAARQLYSEDVVGVIYNIIRKVHPKKARTPVIKREPLSRSEYELRTYVGQLHRAARRILEDKVYDPTPGHHCGWKCAYWEPCLCLQDGTDFTAIIDDLYIRKEVA